MPATVIINRWTGAGPSDTDITSINTRANAYDTHSTADTTNPIAIPSMGTYYSYVVWTRLHCSVTPATIINNIKWFTDGANSLGTGCGMNAGTTASYTQATGTPGTTGISGGGSDAFAYTSGSPLSVTGSISNPSTGNFGNYVYFQITVGSTASPGATGSETVTWQYDES